MNTYRAFGISIASEIPLPPLPPARERPDVSIRSGRVGAPRPPASRTATTFRGSADEGVLVMQDVACVHVRDGQEVVVEPLDGAPEEAVRSMLLGPVLAILMSQRGLTTLHASAIVFDGQAVAFMGDAGWGKSTLAATFFRRGYPLVADDVVAIRFDGGRPRALPAVPQLKLTPRVVGALGEDPSRLPRVSPRTEKRLRAVQEGFVTTPPVLSHVYVLAPGEPERIAPIASSEAAIELVRHSFGARSLQPTAPARYLRQAARLAEAVRVRRLGLPFELERLDAVADAVEADLGADR
jgi:hypothetical protein